MASGLKIIDTENLSREKTLLIKYYLNNTGEWVYALDNCGYKPVCDEYWTIMYPNFQHPQHTDASPDRPLVILTGSLYGVFAWNYGGIPGIQPSDFDAEHSYLVQVTMVNQGCLFTGNNTGQTGSGGTTGSVPVTGIHAPPQSGYYPPRGPGRITPGYGAPPYPKIPDIPIIVHNSGTLIRINDPDPGTYAGIVQPENGYYSKPVEFASGTLDYTNIPLRDLAIGNNPIKPSLFYGNKPGEVSEDPMFMQKEKDRNNLPSRFDNKLNSDPAGWMELNPNASFSNKNLTPSFVFGDQNSNDMSKVGRSNKQINNSSIDLLVEGSRATGVLYINRTAALSGGSTLDSRAGIPSLSLIPGITSDDLSTKIPINELPANLEVGSYNSKNYSALDTASDSATRPYTSSSVSYNADIVISNPVVRRGELLTIAASCYPNTDVSIYAKLIIVDTEGKQVEAATSSVAIANSSEASKIAITTRTDIYALGKIIINALFFDSNNNIVANASKAAEVIDQIIESASALPKTINSYRLPTNGHISDNLARYAGVNINKYVDFYIDNTPRYFIFRMFAGQLAFVIKSLNATTLDTNLIAKVYDPDVVGSMAGSSTRRVDIIQHYDPVLTVKDKIKINDATIFENEHVIGTKSVSLPFDMITTPILSISKNGSNVDGPAKVRMYLNDDANLIVPIRISKTNDGLSDIATYNLPYAGEEIRMLVGGKDQYDIPDDVVTYSATGSLIGEITYTIETSLINPDNWIHLLKYPYSIANDIIYSERFV